MVSSTMKSSNCLESFGALSQLVEAASTMSELEVKPISSSDQHPLRTALVSDDDEMSRGGVGRHEEPITATTGITINANASGMKVKRKEIFPQKLMEILSDDSLSDIVSWLPHGQSFVITRPQDFCEKVLPKYSVSTKYPSFTRKLNRWGFRQAIRGSDTGAFHHPFFRRDQPELCAKMVCQKSRDRHGASKQQQQQHSRSLPPKKRTIPEIIAPTFTSSTTTLPSFVPITSHAQISVNNDCRSSNETTCAFSYKLQPATTPAHVLSDVRSLNNSSSIKSNTTPLCSASCAITRNNVDKLAHHAASSIEVQSDIRVPPIIKADITIRASTLITTTTSKPPNNKIPSTTSYQGSIMSFVSNDKQFVAETLRRRDILEIVRATKAMLYESYMEARNEENQGTN